MNQNYQLCSPWCVWLNYLVTDDQNTKADYNDRIKKIHTIKTYHDLIYYWQQSKFRNLSQFFVSQHDETNNKFYSYQIDQKTRTVNAINYFREGIDPTWEDENNKNGGRLIFQINKDMEYHQKIYQWLIFYFLGQSEPSAQQINGIRFISHKPSAPFNFHYRVQVWSKFNLSEQNKVKELRDTFVKDFFNQFLSNNPNLKKNFQPTFKNNQDDKEKQKKQEQEKPKA